MYIVLGGYMRTLGVCLYVYVCVREEDRTFFTTSGQINTLCIINPHLLPYLIFYYPSILSIISIYLFIVKCFCDDVIKNTSAA